MTPRRRSLKAQQTKNVSGVQIETLAKHYRRFSLEFGSRRIHEISALEIETWLGSRVDERNGSPWSAKTRNSVQGSLVSLSLYAQKVLKAIPDNGRTEFQQVTIPRADEKGEVEIYAPDELKLLLLVAIDTDLDLIPPLIVGNFLGLRPSESHAEKLKRAPLQWEAFNWGEPASPCKWAESSFHRNARRPVTTPGRSLAESFQISTWCGLASRTGT